MTEERHRGASWRNDFLYWWPVLARVVGIGMALGQGAYSAITHQSADVAFLGFCGVLVAAPIVFEQQDKRNRGRRDDE